MRILDRPNLGELVKHFNRRCMGIWELRRRMPICRIHLIDSFSLSLYLIQNSAMKDKLLGEDYNLLS